MSADNKNSTNSSSAGLRRPVPASHSLMAAALALPGLAATLAHAESAPEKGIIGFKYLNYSDWQPSNPNDNNQEGNGKRTHVTSPSFYLLAPIGSQWSIEGSAVADSVTGATPYYHSLLSKASGGQVDYRHAMDLKATRYFEKMAIGVGTSYSEEHDYTSRALSVDGRFYFDNNNTVLALGTGVSNDIVRGGGVIQNDPRLGPDVGKHSNDYLIGITRVLTPLDVLQSNVTYSAGRGDFSERYKEFYAGIQNLIIVPPSILFEGDVRPQSRYQFAWLTRWNHYFPGVDGALHLSYRYYSDSYGIKSHTIGTEWFQPIAYGITLVPEVRFYSQSAAHFYTDLYPNGAPAVFNPNPAQMTSFLASTGGLISFDQRLSAYGAYTVGLKVIKELPKDITMDVKGEYYDQRGSYRLGGSGSTANLPFKAMFLQLGISKKF